MTEADALDLELVLKDQVTDPKAKFPETIAIDRTMTKKNWIGRDPKQNGISFRLKSAQVSAKHAYLSAKSKCFHLKGSKTTNGTTIQISPQILYTVEFGDEFVAEFFKN